MHRLFIQELVQGTFEEANDKKIISKAIKSIIEEEIVSSLREKKETLLKKISAKLISEEKVSEELAINSAKEGFEEVERLLQITARQFNFILYIFFIISQKLAQI